MKTPFKSTLIAASVAVLGINAAFADDSQLQTRLALQRQEMRRNQSTPTIAVYACARGVGQVQRTEQREQQYVWKTRQVGNGPLITYRVPAK